MSKIYLVYDEYRYDGESMLEISLVRLWRLLSRNFKNDSNGI